MSTLIRPELSETNRYWIEKHRYYELKHFCLQYPLWRHAYNSLIDYPGSWPQLVPPCKTKAASSSDSNSPLRPPTSLEAQENLMISLAVQCAEKQLRDGTASSQVITHYLKLGSSKERIEKEILEKRKELIEAKTKNLNSNSEAKELYNKALEAFRRYSGAGGDDDEY